MLFEVINKDSRCVMSTTQKACTYAKSQRDEMIKAGYRFKVDGKLLSKDANVDMIVDASLASEGSIPKSSDTLTTAKIVNDIDNSSESDLIRRALGF